MKPVDPRLTIDGALGEGGGQVLRSALALSIVTGRPFRIENIRAGRKKPGLLRQHLTAVNAAARIANATVQGATLSSTELVFEPGEMRPGEHHFSIGTAGSTTLVAQTILLPLLVSKEPSRVVIEGGTHNPSAPPFDHFARAFVPLLERMGARLAVRLARPGFHPAGGGRIEIDIEPSKLQPIELEARGAPRSRMVRSVLAQLPEVVAERELGRVRESFPWDESEFRTEEVTGSISPGNVLFIDFEYENVTEIVTAFGSRSVRAERVAAEVVASAKVYLISEAPVGEYLADQLLLPLAIAGGGRFRTTRVTRHTTTNLEVIEMFLDIDSSIETLGRNDSRIILEAR